jgi:hypothetical protein
MTWLEYEQTIHDYFTSQFPNADISHNVKIEGRFSKVQRQIDVLIEDYVAGNRMRIIIDGKFFSKKIDVKHVEMFIGMLNDCNANKGLLITQEGFTQAAISRAYHDPIDIELDIFNFKELLEYQQIFAIPHNGVHGVIMYAPFGWIIDLQVGDNSLGTVYQRGLTLQDARSSREWISINIVSKNDQLDSLEKLLQIHELSQVANDPGTKIAYISTVKRDDANTKMCLVKTNSTLQYTGYVDFQEFIFYSTLITPEELQKKNVRKLESIMQQILHLDILEKIFKWDIEKGQKGIMMFLDVKYFLTSGEEQFLTLCVARDYNIDRPAFISIILPHNVDQSNGIFLKFGKTIYSEEGLRGIEVSPDIFRTQFESNDDETCRARIIDGFIKDDGGNIDIFQKFMDNDHVYFLFTYKNGMHKSVAVPLFSFKQQFHEM